MDIKQTSTSSLLISFGDIISQDISTKVRCGFEAIKSLQDIAIYEIVPSYTTISLSFDIFVYDFETIRDKLSQHIAQFTPAIDDTEDDIVYIDVCYDKQFGLDLDRISQTHNISIDDIVAFHTATTYDVHAMGFLPGFGFLGLVDDSIATPRLQTPRKKVPKGSVGIADRQTAVYPQDSAGGWNIIGQTRKNLFDKNLPELSPLAVGKKVKFRSISLQEFEATKTS